MSHASRWAIYYSPPADHPLWALGCRWLGRANDGDRPVFSASHQAITAAPRRYGLHATLKAPMRLGPHANLSDLAACTAEIARRHAPFTLSLAVAALGAFVALRPTGGIATLAMLAEDCLRSADDLRASAASADIADAARRRAAHDLSERQQTYLARWGYPYVLEDYRFHITLTAALPGNRQRAIVAEQARHWFADALAAPVPFDDLSLWQEPGPEQDFELVRRVPLGG